MEAEIDTKKHDNFKKWIQLNGCKIHPCIDVFSTLNGNVGVSTSETIPSHKVLIAIPEKLILVAEKVYDTPELKDLFASNDDLFDYEACE